jgi:hypothetical protein
MLSVMSDTKHVVLIHGTWARGDGWGPTRAVFEERGYNVHTPTLRYHELPLQEGAMKIPRSDHLVFFGDALPVTMGQIDDWIAKNHLLSTA